MTQSINAVEPQKLLLATDLSAHCDRPLERARQLAAEWQAELAVLTVSEGPEVPAEVVGWLEGDAVHHAAEAAAQRALAREFDGSGIKLSLHLAEGPVADAIPAAAERLHSTLVIAGSARSETLGHLLLGSTVERLARSLSQPLLVVRRRAQDSYRRILVPTDFSHGARMALETAAALFPGRGLTVFHVQETGMEALAGTMPASATDTTTHAACARFLDSCRLPGGARERIELVVGAGKLETLLTRHVLEHDIELAVIGLHSQPGVLRVLMGNTADRLLRSLPCDTLLVRAGGHDDAS